MPCLITSTSKPFPFHRRFRLGSGLWLGLLLLALLAGGSGCSWLGLGGDEPQEGEAEEEPAIPPDPYKAGMLRAVSNAAPPGSTSQFLANLALSMGWEAEVQHDFSLRMAAEAGAFDDKVEPRLLGLFFAHGYSVLPQVGDQHEFSRDAIIRASVSNSRLLVRTRDPVRLIFMGGADNLTIIYPKGGAQPQVFALNKEATITLRESLLNQYLD